jgi:hypothetical protein
MMTMELTRSQEKERSQRIRRDIRTVLMTHWDPIGVKDEPMAADEYDGYIGAIYGLLTSTATANAISDHLREIEIKRMGFSEEQVPQHLDVAARLKQILLD